MKSSQISGKLGQIKTGTLGSLILDGVNLSYFYTSRVFCSMYGHVFIIVNKLPIVFFQLVFEFIVYLDNFLK